MSDGTTSVGPGIFHRQASSAQNVEGAAISSNSGDADDPSGGIDPQIRNSPGLILIWSMKNPKNPERIILSQGPVTAIDFSTGSPSLLAVGDSHGTLSVYSIRTHESCREPLFTSMNMHGQHTDPIWRVKWTMQQNRSEQIVTVSSDGRIASWSMKKGLEVNELMKLKRVRNESIVGAGDASSDAFITYLVGGLSVDFCCTDNSVYVAGTESGTLHRCSTSYTESYLDTYHGHVGSVCAVRWNPFSSDHFLTCSTDWTICLWNQYEKEPVLTLSSSPSYVNDIAWSHQCSTVFASVSEIGRLDVWDLGRSPLDPVLFTSANDRSFTVVAFSPSFPVLAVGDSKGCVGLYRHVHLSASSLTQEEQAAVLTRLIEASRAVS